MFVPVRNTLRLLALAASVAACSRPSAGGGATPSALRQGAFERRIDLTGEVRAERGEFLTVPQTPAWQLPIRWLVEDGATVAAGDRLVEFDNGQIAGDLDQKRAGATEAEAALRKARAEADERIEQRQFELDKARDELAKAKIQAEVPEGVLPGKEYGDRQLALQTARAATEKAEAALERARAEIGESVGAAELALAQKGRELGITERNLDALVLRAPRAGLALIQDHPWEGRKLQNGDSIFPGWAVVAIPDLDSLQVQAALYDVDDGEIHAGDEARCLADAYPEEIFPCHVREVAAVAREISGMSTRRVFRVLVSFDDRERARARLRPGMSMRAEVIAERRPGARTVARAALLFDRDAVRWRSPAGALESVKLGPCNATDCVLEGPAARPAGGSPEGAP
ncbi:MAG: HlyD family efflux transporter periplasmic adaptor subunit [Thermoanaerobaculia bacterium]